MEIQRMLEARIGKMLEPKWRSRYTNKQMILLVGEGNFSFSSCLATTFGAATNMVATSLDSRDNPVGKRMGECGADELLKKYGTEAELNTLNLSQRGALVLHGFDACKMCGSQMSFFHRIIFNFPHAGFLGREDVRGNNAELIPKHKELVRLFFANARHMLLPGGQIHVSHKLGPLYDSWMLEEEAQVGGLRLVERVPFHREHFPGYQNCVGDGLSAGKQFFLGQADTYIFAARNEEPPAEPLRMSTSNMLDHLKSLKEKAIRKARASQVTPLQQVVADEVARLEKLTKEKKLGKKKLRTLETLKSALQQMNLLNFILVKALTVGDPVGMSSNMLDHLKSLKEKAIRSACASQVTPLQQVVADEVARLEKLEEEKKLGKKKMKTLETLKSALKQMNLESSPISVPRGELGLQELGLQEQTLCVISAIFGLLSG